MQLFRKGEWELVKLYCIDGLNVRQIGERVGRDPSHVAGTLRSIRRRLAKRGLNVVPLAARQLPRVKVFADLDPEERQELNSLDETSARRAPWVPNARWNRGAA